MGVIQSYGDLSHPKAIVQMTYPKTIKPFIFIIIFDTVEGWGHQQRYSRVQQLRPLYLSHRHQSGAFPLSQQSHQAPEQGTWWVWWKDGFSRPKEKLLKCDTKIMFVRCFQIYSQIWYWIVFLFECIYMFPATLDIGVIELKICATVFVLNQCLSNCLESFFCWSGSSIAW